MRSLSLDEKALRRARIDDWCARNRVETIRAIELTLSMDELEEIAGRKLPGNFWGQRSINRPKLGGPEPS